MDIEEQLQKARDEGYQQGFVDGRNYQPVRELVGKAKRIQEIVCEYFDTDMDVILSASRKYDICYPRHAMVYLLLTHTKMGPTAISRIFMKHHTTILQNKDSIQDRIDTDDFVRRDMQILNEKIMQCLPT